MQVINIETDDIGPLKTVIGLLNNVIREVNFKFCKNVKKKDGKTKNDDENMGQIKIFTTDPNKVMIIYVTLNGSAFSKFFVSPQIYSVGINIDELCKFIKHVNNDGIMAIRVDSDSTQHIEFEVKSSNNAPDSICQLRVVDVKDEEENKLISKDVNLWIRINCDAFHKECKNLHQFAQFIEITCDATQLSITCKGDVSNHKRIFRDDGTSESIKIQSVNDKKNNSPNIIRHIFDLKYINFMHKAKDLCDDMLIKLSDDIMCLEYNIKLMGKMIICIAPAVKKREQINYDISNEKYYENDEIELI
jgi:proliferating cell nuclear antigen PCNA